MLKIIQRVFFKNKEKKSLGHTWDFFKELEESLNLIEDLDKIGGNFLGRIKEILHVEQLILLLYDQDLGKFKVSNFQGFKPEEISKISLLSNQPLIKWLKVNKSHLYFKNQPGVFSYLSDEERALITKVRIELCFPLVSMNRLIGIIFLGEKNDRSEYNSQELKIISALTPQTGIALENAVLYKEQRERFRRMSRADKLATIGELAAGAAHEIRNPLTAIKSTLQYINTKNQEEKNQKLLSSALKETERIDNILTALLSFSRPSELKKETGDLLEILDESLELISFQARKQKVNIMKDFLGPPLILTSDKSQIKQLFLNIFLNAIQAMPSGGELKVEAGKTSDEMAFITITDTGTGISDKNLDKIFDPFFTTKKGGTGLGLSICYGIVKSHKGEIEIKNNQVSGMTTLIKLPLHLMP